MGRSTLKLARDRKLVVVGARVERRLKDKMSAAAKQQGHRSLSDFIRAALERIMDVERAA